MQFPARFADLPEYPFARLRRLLEGVPPGGPELAMSIGEPKHPLPAMVAEVVAAHAHEFAVYPPNEGVAELREAVCGWVARRYGVAVDPDTQVIALISKPPAASVTATAGCRVGGGARTRP